MTATERRKKRLAADKASNGVAEKLDRKARRRRGAETIVVGLADLADLSWCKCKERGAYAWTRSRVAASVTRYPRTAPSSAVNLSRFLPLRASLLAFNSSNGVDEAT
jgi:hypothetical protein